jgi:hypothetical protein
MQRIVEVDAARIIHSAEFVNAISTGPTFAIVNSLLIWN